MRPGRRSVIASRPARPTTSPKNNILMRTIFSCDDRLEAASALLGDDEVERHVVGVARDLVELLSGEGDADEAGALAQLVEGAVVIAAAIAEARAALVETEQRHDDDVGLDLRGELGGGEGAEAGFVERRALFPQAQFER